MVSLEMICEISQILSSFGKQQFKILDIDPSFLFINRLTNSMVVEGGSTCHADYSTHNARMDS